MINPVAVSIYFLLWISFGVGHSILAGALVRRWIIAHIGSYERLAYNGIAACHLAVVLLSGAWLLGRAPAFGLPVAAKMIFGITRGIGLFGIIWALREYDLGRFAGLTQIRDGKSDTLDTPNEAFVVTGLHRYVRHPLYAASILYLAGGATTLLGLATALFATVYFVIGLRFEERKLTRLYGSAYGDYRSRTPALVPFWRPH